MFYISFYQDYLGKSVTSTVVIEFHDPLENVAGGFIKDAHFSKTDKNL